MQVVAVRTVAQRVVRLTLAVTLPVRPTAQHTLIVSIHIGVVVLSAYPRKTAVLNVQPTLNVWPTTVRTASAALLQVTVRAVRAVRSWVGVLLTGLHRFVVQRRHVPVL